jgi:hypothetical protein
VAGQLPLAVIAGMHMCFPSMVLRVPHCAVCFAVNFDEHMAKYAHHRVKHLLQLTCKLLAHGDHILVVVCLSRAAAAVTRNSRSLRMTPAGGLH